MFFNIFPLFIIGNTNLQTKTGSITVGRFCLLPISLVLPFSFLRAKYSQGK